MGLAVSLALSLAAVVATASAYVTRTPNGHRVSLLLRHAATN